MEEKTSNSYFVHKNNYLKHKLLRHAPEVNFVVYYVLKMQHSYNRRRKDKLAGINFLWYRKMQ